MFVCYRICDHLSIATMARILRLDKAGLVYHVINRANERKKIFESSRDYVAFEKLIFEAWARTCMRIYSYSIMPNHWHFVVSPIRDGDLCSFFRWLTLSHTQYYRKLTGTVGCGHLYQGRYKSFVVASDGHFLKLCKYVERNALRAGLVKKAEFWRWSSLHKRTYGDEKSKQFLSKWPVRTPLNYSEWVNDDEEKSALRKIENSIKRSAPLGEGNWIRKVAEQFGLKSTIEKVGRPPAQKPSLKIVPDPIFVATQSEKNKVKNCT